MPLKERTLYEINSYIFKSNLSHQEPCWSVPLFFRTQNHIFPPPKIGNLTDHTLRLQRTAIFSPSPSKNHSQIGWEYGQPCETLVSQVLFCSSKEILPDANDQAFPLLLMRAERDVGEGTQGQGVLSHLLLLPNCVMQICLEITVFWKRVFPNFYCYT